MTETIETVYEDESIIAVNKPNNILVYASYFARNIKEDDLLTLLKEQVGQNLYPIHRLDRKTSGIILLAKEKEFVKDYQQQFEKNLVQKHYYAVVRGFSQTKGIIGKKELESMKKDGVLINVARGRVVDEESLYQALFKKTIGGAVIDVWYKYIGVDKKEIWPLFFSLFFCVV